MKMSQAQLQEERHVAPLTSRWAALLLTGAAAYRWPPYTWGTAAQHQGRRAVQQRLRLVKGKQGHDVAAGHQHRLLRMVQAHHTACVIVAAP